MTVKHPGKVNQYKKVDYDRNKQLEDYTMLACMKR